MGYSPWGHKELDTTEATEQLNVNHSKIPNLSGPLCPSLKGRIGVPLWDYYED